MELNRIEWFFMMYKANNRNQIECVYHLHPFTSHCWQKDKAYRNMPLQRGLKKKLFLEIQRDFYLCKESRLVLFEKTRQIWLMGCHEYTYYSLFGIVDRVTCDRWASWFKAHDSLCTAVLSQTSLPRPVKASEPSGIRTGDMRANCAAGRPDRRLTEGIVWRRECSQGRVLGFPA